MSTKPNFDTHAAYVSLINAGFDEKKATQLIETIKDSQTDLATKTDIDKITAQLEALEHRVVIKIGSICAAAISIAVVIARMLT